MCGAMVIDTADQACLLPFVWMSDVHVLSAVPMVAWIQAVGCCRLYQ